MKIIMKQITAELIRHIPFTALGAATGIVIMIVLVLSNAPSNLSSALFYILHPAHIILSALVTTALYRRYGKDNFLMAVIIGYTGAVGFGTLSDSVMPYLGGLLLKIPMEFHAPFIEAAAGPFASVPEWVIVNGAAAIGIAIGYLKPKTRLPHATHVFLSTWATLFNFTAFGVANWLPLMPLIFVFLFLSVWLPCCFSDIVYPLIWRIGEHPNS